MLRNYQKQEEMKSSKIKGGASCLPFLHDTDSWKTSRMKQKSSSPHWYAGLCRITQHSSDGSIIRVSPQQSSFQVPCLQPLLLSLFSHLNPVNKSCCTYTAHQVTCRCAAPRRVCASEDALSPPLHLSQGPALHPGNKYATSHSALLTKQLQILNLST